MLYLICERSDWPLINLHYYSYLFHYKLTIKICNVGKFCSDIFSAKIFSAKIFSVRQLEFELN